MMRTVSMKEMSRDLSGWLDRVSHKGESVVVRIDEQAQVVMLSVDVFDQLLGVREREGVPLPQFRREFRQALAAAGYNSRDKILALIQGVKRDLAAERLDATT